MRISRKSAWRNAAAEIAPPKSFVPWRRPQCVMNSALNHSVTRADIRETSVICEKLAISPSGMA